MSVSMLYEVPSSMVPWFSANTIATYASHFLDDLGLVAGVSNRKLIYCNGWCLSKVPRRILIESFLILYWVGECGTEFLWDRERKGHVKRTYLFAGWCIGFVTRKLPYKSWIKLREKWFTNAHYRHLAPKYPFLSWENSPDIWAFHSWLL